MVSFKSKVNSFIVEFVAVPGGTSKEVLKGQSHECVNQGQGGIDLDPIKCSVLLLLVPVINFILKHKKQLKPNV